MLVRDQVLSLLSELKFLKKTKTKRAKIKLPHASYGSGLSVSFVNWALD